MTKIVRKNYLFKDFPPVLTSTENFIEKVHDLIKKKQKANIYYLNAFSISLVSKNNEFRNAIKHASYIYPDGWGSVWFLRVIGKKIKERTNAADFIDMFFNKINKRGVSMYLLGDEAKVVREAYLSIRSQYENIKIVGYRNGFFKNSESSKIIEDINSKKPDLILIGMGQPKQELWIHNNFSKLSKAVYWCVGGLFGYLARTKRRAPDWALNLKLEWLYRFFQEPRRLFHRYTLENLFFLFLLVETYIKKKYK